MLKLKKNSIIFFRRKNKTISFAAIFLIIICSASCHTVFAQNTSAGVRKKSAATQVKAPTYEEVKNLLQKNTCLACHNPNTRQVGPAYKDVAKRKYSISQIIELIHNPKPEHWPDYSTPMPPMTQVSTEEAHKIAEWIKSLEKAK